MIITSAVDSHPNHGKEDAEMYKRSTFIFCIAVVLAGLLLAAGCGSSNKEGSEQPILGAPSPTGNIQASIQSAVVSATTGSLTVTFSLLDEKGAPLDPVALLAAGGRCRFYVAQLDGTGHYKNYVFNNGLPTYDRAASAGFATVGSGVYTYTFKTNIGNDPGFDAARTHTVVAQISRDVPNSIGKTFTQTANPYRYFRPDGNPVTETREIVAISNCNECHGSLSGHGTRKEIVLCIVCHYPGVSDPDTGNAIDMKSMIHKLHMGSKLSSNVKGAVYGIAEANFKTIVYPNRTGDSFSNTTAIDCVKCHKVGQDMTGKTFGKDVDRWKTNPSKYNCGTCHDTYTFETGVTSMTFTTSLFDASGAFTGATTTTLAVTPHSGGTDTPALDDATCAGCHTPVGDPVSDLDYSTTSSNPIPMLHLLPMKSSLVKNISYNIMSVSAVSGQTVTVQFSVQDGTGAEYILTGGGGSNTFNDPVVIAFAYMNGPDYDNSSRAWLDAPTALTYVQGRTKTVSSTSQSPTAFYDAASHSYIVSMGTFTVPDIPGAVGSIAVYGRQGITIPTNENTAHRTAAQHISYAFAPVAYYYFDFATGAQVTDPAKQRRKVVDIDKCNVCHTNINVHSRNETQLCAMCHAPKLYVISTASYSTGYAGNLKDMVHGIHGATLSTKVFRGVDKAEYPNDPRKCAACHIDGTATFPLPAGVAGSLITGSTNTKVDGTPVLPMKATCTSCHEDQMWKDHADSETVNGAEMCNSCHSTGLTFSPANAHQPAQ